MKHQMYYRNEKTSKETHNPNAFECQFTQKPKNNKEFRVGIKDTTSVQWAVRQFNNTIRRSSYTKNVLHSFSTQVAKLVLSLLRLGCSHWSEFQSRMWVAYTDHTKPCTQIEIDVARNEKFENAWTWFNINSKTVLLFY